MDKKRRDNTPNKKNISQVACKRFWLSKVEPVEKQKTCGVLYKKYQFLPTCGKGSFELYQFDGLFVSIADVCLYEDVKVSGCCEDEILELSFLMEGEQIVNLENFEKDLIYESQEHYLLYLYNNSGTIRYLKEKNFKEIKVQMHAEFIEKHHLNEEFEIQKKIATKIEISNIFEPIEAKTQEILAEIVADKKQGLLKRLFLESKVLELLALYLERNKKNSTKQTNQSPKLLKKMYEIQGIINSDFTEQFSIQELSRKVGLNDFVVKKEFKRVFGLTIFEYTSNQRMLKAKELLTHSTLPIYEISESVGYKNSTHFTAAFKKQEGTTPKKFRKAITDK